MNAFAFLHPLRALKLAIRRWTLRADLRSPQIGGEIPPVLMQFSEGELLAWKGVNFRVGKIAGGDFPALILVPSGITKGAKLRGLRNMRDAGRAHLQEQKATRKSLREVAR
jgi:hypothetical protein